MTRFEVLLLVLVALGLVTYAVADLFGAVGLGILGVALLCVALFVNIREG